MSSTNTYTEQKYCVYITYYSGNALPSKNNSLITPSNYIGSTSIKHINNGYKGSVRSKTYRSIWESELKENPYLFSIEIISYHDTRPEATYKELQIQKIFNVVKNPLFVNMSYAAPNGFCGMYNAGENHPVFGKGYLFAGENNPMYGKSGELSPVYGKPREDLVIRNKLNAEQGNHPSQIRAINGNHHWQSTEHSINMSNKQKKLAEQGLHISQIQAKNGNHHWQSDECKQNTKIRTKNKNLDNMSRPLYLEVKALCEEKKYTKPPFLHMKSEEFLTQLKVQLLQ